ncbi:MAG TPA: hypothetical protein VLK84_20835, partial [Longimicrobium sp.]|nr:hypothetical protein [Longimicrobium sp.]
DDDVRRPFVQFNVVADQPQSSVRQPPLPQSTAQRYGPPVVAKVSSEAGESPGTSLVAKVSTFSESSVSFVCDMQCLLERVVVGAFDT